MNARTNPVAKALWYIENNFASELLLEEIANVAGVSRYHVSRAFGEAIGRPVTGYVRGRRLTEAAKVLAAGAAWKQVTALTRHSRGRSASSSG
jgi:AraC family transcriptional regulator